MTIRSIAASLCSSALILLLPLGAAASSEGSLVSCVEKSQRSLNDLSATFTQKTTIVSLRRSETGKGSLLMKFGGGRTKFRFDYTKPQQSIVTDGTTLWYHQPGLRQVVRTRLERFLSGENSLAMSYLGGLRNLSADFEPRRGKDDAEGNPRLILTPRKKGEILKELELTLSREACDGISSGTVVRFPILRSVIIDQGGNRTEMTYQKPVVNQGVGDSRFTFSPPPGTTVIDQ
ncbi:MAG: outer membrane lipoprotein chaperone LolA [Desulfuromonadia bacterium]